MKKSLACIFYLFCVSVSFSQDFSNKGKDFWVGYGFHTVMTQSNAQEMVLYFATDQVTTVTVSIPGTGYSQTYSNIPANTVFTSNPIPKAGSQSAILSTETAAGQDKGIHVVSDKAIVAYAHIYNSSVSGASILFPTNTLGKEYYSINYTNISNANNANCWFYVIACDTGTTTVEIIPSGNTLTHLAGVPFTVTLTQGQVYNVMGQLNGGTGTFTGVDLTGSKIRSIASGTSGCKRIAVFSGSGRISITCSGLASSSDNYIVQSLPKNAWGKKYLTSPTGGGMSNNIFRICVSDPAAVVTLNGAPIPYPLINNFYYDLPATAAPQRIESNLPITVAQYITSQGACGNGTPGDPEVIYLSPVEQNISSVLWNATPNFAIVSHFINVIIPNRGTALSSFKLDGNPVNPSLFTVHPQDPNYSYLTQTIGSGQRRIESDSGFNAIAYGFGTAESYGYNAGTNVRDLYQQIGVASQYGIETTPSICTGSPFKFKVSLPYLADSIRWNLSNLPGTPANVLINYSSPAVPSDADSTDIVNGKTIYWYSLPTFYSFNTTGTFPVTITTYSASAEGCGNEQAIDFNLEISNPPTAVFSATFNGCVNQSVQFNDVTVSTKPIYKWWWNFGDPASGAANTSTLQNPVHLFSAPGTYTVRFSNITTPGCLSDTISQTIIVNPLPAGNVSGDIIVCHNAPSPAVTFTGVVGTAPFTFTYNINNGPVQTAVTSIGNSITVPAPTNTVGTYRYHLVSVKDAAGTAGCFQLQADTAVVVVNPLPTASITGDAIVCQNAASPLITFTAAGGSAAPFSFTYSINAGPTQTISTASGNSVTLAVPTNISGTFIYSLVSVRDASATACSQLQTGSASITVNASPAGTISGSAQVCVNETAPLVNFTGASGTAPYTFTYTLNSGAPQTITTIGNNASITVPTAAAGNFEYQLISVKDASTGSCTSLLNQTATVTVNPLPTGNFTISGVGCVSRAILFQDNSVANAGAINSWSWSFGDPASGAANTSVVQNPVHLFAAPGNYTVTLTVTNDKGCSGAVFSRVITISELPRAGFILPEVCLLDPFAQFTDTSRVGTPQTISGWQWNFGDPGSGPLNTSGIQNAQHTYPAVGNYNVRLIVSTNNGCTDTLTQVLTVNGGNPVAAFVQLNPASSCSVDSVAIQNKSTIASGNITKMEIYWDNNGQPAIFETDEFPFFDKIYKHKYPTSATTQNYTIRYRAFSGGVCVNERLQTITVLATPVVQISSIPNQCFSDAPLVLNFGSTVNTMVGTGSYSGPGVVLGGSWNFIPSLAGIGTHTIQYKFTTTAGGCADSISTSVTVLDTAMARFSVSGALCEKNTISFNDLSSAPAGVTLLNSVWDFGDGSPPQTFLPGQAVSHIFPAATNYTVRMFNTSTAGCISAVASNDISVKPIPVANFSFPDTLCLPAASVQFRNLSSIADATENTFLYQWNFGDAASGPNNVSTGLNPTHIYTTNGPFAVTLKVTSGAGCVHDTIKTINTLHPQPRAGFTISRPAGICIGDNVSFTDQSNGADGSITNWQWNFGDGNSSSQQNPGYLYNTVGAYSVSLYIVNNFGCKSDTVRRPFTVNAYPVVNAGPDRFVLESGSIVLQPVVTAINPVYLWEPATYLNNSTLANPTSSPLNDITYKVTVSGRGGCTASDIVFVKLLLGPKIPNTFSPNGDGINERWTIEYLDTYPNNRVQVFTRAGQLVFESRGYTTPWNGTMNGKTLPIDTYYYIIEPGNGRKPLTGFVTILK
jgi:gliding motility-associated-like protein